MFNEEENTDRAVHFAEAVPHRHDVIPIVNDRGTDRPAEIAEALAQSTFLCEAVPSRTEPETGSALRTGFGNATIDHGMERPSDVKHSVADMDKTRRAGFRPVFDLVGGLLTTLEFFKEDLGATEQGCHV